MDGQGARADHKNWGSGGCPFANPRDCPFYNKDTQVHDHAPVSNNKRSRDIPDLPPSLMKPHEYALPPKSTLKELQKEQSLMEEQGGHELYSLKCKVAELEGLLATELDERTSLQTEYQRLKARCEEAEKQLVVAEEKASKADFARVEAQEIFNSRQQQVAPTSAPQSVQGLEILLEATNKARDLAQNFEEENAQLTVQLELAQAKIKEQQTEMEALSNATNKDAEKENLRKALKQLERGRDELELAYREIQEEKKRNEADSAKAFEQAQMSQTADSMKYRELNSRIEEAEKVLAQRTEELVATKNELDEYKKAPTKAQHPASKEADPIPLKQENLTWQRLYDANADMERREDNESEPEEEVRKSVPAAPALAEERDWQALDLLYRCKDPAFAPGELKSTPRNREIDDLKQTLAKESESFENAKTALERERADVFDAAQKALRERAEWDSMVSRHEKEKQILEAARAEMDKEKKEWEASKIQLSEMMAKAEAESKPETPARKTTPEKTEKSANLEKKYEGVLEARKKLEQDMKEFDDQKAKFEEQKAKLDEQEAKFMEQKAALDIQVAKCEEQERNLEKEKAKLEGTKEVSKSETYLGDQELAKARQKLDEDLKDLNQQKAKLEVEAQKWKDARDSLLDQQEIFDKEVEEFEARKERASSRRRRRSKSDPKPSQASISVAAPTDTLGPLVLGQPKWEEFRTFASVQVPLGHLVQIKKVFQEADKNNNGFLSLEELSSWMADIGAGDVTLDTVRDMIQQVDTRRDGTVSVWEFLAIQLYLNMNLQAFQFPLWLLYCTQTAAAGPTNYNNFYHPPGTIGLRQMSVTMPPHAPPPMPSHAATMPSHAATMPPRPIANQPQQPITSPTAMKAHATQNMIDQEMDRVQGLRMELEKSKDLVSRQKKDLEEEQWTLQQTRREVENEHRELQFSWTQIEKQKVELTNMQIRLEEQANELRNDRVNAQREQHEWRMATKALDDRHIELERAFRKFDEEKREWQQVRDNTNEERNELFVARKNLQDEKWQADKASEVLVQEKSDLATTMKRIEEDRVSTRKMLDADKEDLVRQKSKLDRMERDLAMSQLQVEEGKKDIRTEKGQLEKQLHELRESRRQASEDKMLSQQQKMHLEAEQQRLNEEAMRLQTKDKELEMQRMMIEEDARKTAAGLRSLEIDRKELLLAKNDMLREQRQQRIQAGIHQQPPTKTITMSGDADSWRQSADYIPFPPIPSSRAWMDNRDPDPVQMPNDALQAFGSVLFTLGDLHRLKLAFNALDGDNDRCLSFHEVKKSLASHPHTNPGVHQLISKVVSTSNGLFHFWDFMGIHIYQEHELLGFDPHLWLNYVTSSRDPNSLNWDVKKHAQLLQDVMGKAANRRPSKTQGKAQIQAASDPTMSISSVDDELDEKKRSGASIRAGQFGSTAAGKTPTAVMGADGYARNSGVATLSPAPPGAMANKTWTSTAPRSTAVFL